MNKSLPLAVVALGAVTVAGGVPATAAAATKTTKCTGAKETYKYGSLSVSIEVANKKIKEISTSYTPNDPRSAQIDSEALPQLYTEAMKLQGWDVHTISSASFTSAAFRKSLYSALGHADLLKK